MSGKIKIALCAALVFGTASAALAKQHPGKAPGSKAIGQTQRVEHSNRIAPFALLPGIPFAPGTVEEQRWFDLTTRKAGG